MHNEEITIDQDYQDYIDQETYYLIKELQYGK